MEHHVVADLTSSEDELTLIPGNAEGYCHAHEFPTEDQFFGHTFGSTFGSFFSCRTFHPKWKTNCQVTIGIMKRIYISTLDIF